MSRMPSARWAGRRGAHLRGEPAGRPAPAEAVLGRLAVARPRRARRSAGRRISSTVRSTERTARLSSSRRSAAVLVEARRASTSAAWGTTGPVPRSRAIEMADETLCVSSRAWRSASISASSNCRWPPWLRRGEGKPKRRSQLRSVFGLTPSMAAAAFVRIALMARGIEPLVRFGQLPQGLVQFGRLLQAAGAGRRQRDGGRAAATSRNASSCSIVKRRCPPGVR